MSKQLQLDNPISVYLSKKGLVASCYPELQIFRRLLEQQKSGFHHQPYTSAIEKSKIYQAIFLGIGALFAFLGIYTYNKTMIFAFSLILENSQSLKDLICLFCATFSTGAFAIALSISPEKEAMKHIVRLAKEQLGRTYRKKRSEFGLHKLFSYGEEYRKGMVFTQIYLDAKDKLKEREMEAKLILKQIAHSRTIEPEIKEKLYNQSLLELTDKLNIIVGQFEQAGHP